MVLRGTYTESYLESSVAILRELTGRDLYVELDLGRKYNLYEKLEDDVEIELADRLTRNQMGRLLSEMLEEVGWGE